MHDKAQVLIVDDNAATRYSVRRVLERHGHHVQEAGTGTDGLALIAAEHFDALILDVNLPDMSGFDIVRALRADPRTVLLPVVHVSAASIATRDLITGLDAGADAYLIHPVDPDVLIATLGTLLRVRATEEALRQSESRFRDIFTNISAPIAVLDANLDVLEANPAFSRLLTACNSTAGLAGCVEEDQQPSLASARAALTQQGRWSGTLLMRTGEGLRETEWRIAPYRQPGNGLIFIEDVTEQRQRERAQQHELLNVNQQLANEVAQRAHTEAQLLQAQKMDALGKLTGGIAHDFNNLLTGIISGIELINQRIEIGELKGIERFSDAVMGSARRAASLTHRLLAFSRQQPLDARTINVNDRIRSLEELLRRSIGERVALVFEPGREPLLAKVDPNQLEAAVLNLAINARDALPEGGRIKIFTGLLQVSGDAALTDGPYATVTVEDNGTGIEPALLEKVFDPFFTTKPIGQGTGLGLAMIYGFARQSHGEARIESTLGVGTRVSLLLPAGTTPTEEAAPPTSATPKGHGEHILIIEDTKPVRTLVSALLTEAGYRCTDVANAADGLRILRGGESVQLLLTDIGLPDINGKEVAETARAWRPHLPILFMTGYTENAGANRDFIGPGMDLLVKPFEVRRLLEKIRLMLDG